MKHNAKKKLGEYSILNLTTRWVKRSTSWSGYFVPDAHWVDWVNPMANLGIVPKK
jgi:hypothetical protein